MLSAGVNRDQPVGLAAYVVAESVAEACLRAGGSVIVDAVNAVRPAREQWTGLAERTGTDLRFVEVVCEDEALHRSRLAARAQRSPLRPDPTWSDVERVRADYEPWQGAEAAMPRLRVDSSQPRTAVIDQILEFLAS